MIDETHHPALRSWVTSANGHPQFPIQNLPFGIISTKGEAPRAAVAIGDEVIDLRAIAPMLPEASREVLSHGTLNRLFALPDSERRALRRRLSSLLSDVIHREVLTPHVLRSTGCTLQLPAAIGDYTDFYVGIHHATNVGKLFRPDQPLMANYKYVPIGYHGRASSIRPSGVSVKRPTGQRKSPEREAPDVGPVARLDYELELGVWIGRGNELGETIPIAQASRCIVGLCLLNDWSARDVQAWEYQPLGPFLSKSFQSTISPWVVTMEALAPFRVAQLARPHGDPRPLDYLWDEGDRASGGLNIDLEVTIRSALMREQGLPPLQLAHSHASHMYWTIAQMVTHQASNGCNLRPGDLLGTGTLSGPMPEAYGSLLELTNNGKRSVALPTGERRMFLQDGDEVSLSATARSRDFVPIGFGDCTAVVVGSS